MSRGAFTLFELLVVIVIISLLAGLVLGLVTPIRERVTGQRTAASFQAIISGLTRRAAESGGSVSLIEHPLAGSAAPRLIFMRSGGGGVMVTGEALFGVASEQLTDPASGPRLLLPDDHFADTSLPLMYGAQRKGLGIIGASRPEVTAYRRLALPRGQAAITSAADVGFLVLGSADTASHDRAFRLALGDEIVGEMIADGIAWTPPQETPISPDGRLWIGEYRRTAHRPGSSLMIGGLSVSYRLRGLGLYDGWGREIFFEQTARGGLRLVSAGRDGCLRWNPGPDGVYQTAANASAPAGDDRDGSTDNISSSPEVRP